MAESPVSDDSLTQAAIRLEMAAIRTLATEHRLSVEPPVDPVTATPDPKQRGQPRIGETA